MTAYIGSEDFFNGISVEIGGIIIEIILLSILIPLFIWIYKYKSNRRKKANAIALLFDLFHMYLDL